MRIRFLLATAIFAAACGGADTSPTTNHTIDVFTVNFEFIDGTVTLSAGDTVRWHFASATDGVGHNVRFSPRITGAPPDIGTQANPLVTGTAIGVFNTPGDYHYVCDLHGSMVGEVIVK